MKKSSVILIWGIITSIVYIALSQVINNSDNPSGGLKWVGFLIFFAGLFAGTLQYRNKASGGYVSFGEAYKAGILITLIIAVLSTASFAIFLQMHPEFLTKMLVQAQAQMVNKGMTPEQMEMGLKFQHALMTPVAMSLMGFIASIITGAILSLLSAGICAKKKPLIEEEPPTIEN